MKRRISITIQGNVQSVNFRYETKFQAKALGITGWVKNAAQGTVEVVAEGDEEKLKELIRWCARGPTRARVDKMNFTWQPKTGEFSSFEIK
jgi:acylphosphatase